MSAVPRIPSLRCLYIPNTGGSIMTHADAFDVSQAGGQTQSVTDVDYCGNNGVGDLVVSFRLRGGRARWISGGG